MYICDKYPYEYSYEIVGSRKQSKLIAVVSQFKSHEVIFQLSFEGCGIEAHRVKFSVSNP